MIALLPLDGDQSPDDHMAISRRFVAQARDELANGERLQASEKAWGAAAHALKSVAAQRGWYHDDHLLIMGTAIQLGHEFDLRDFEDRIRIAATFHSNFYSNRESADSIRNAIDMVERFVADLDAVRSLPPRPFQVRNGSDRTRLQQLLGRRVEENESSEDGFINHARLERLRRRREREDLPGEGG